VASIIVLWLIAEKVIMFEPKSYMQPANELLLLDSDSLGKRLCRGFRLVRPTLGLFLFVDHGRSLRNPLDNAERVR
jgi:hypothetical protein